MSVSQPPRQADTTPASRRAAVGGARDERLKAALKANIQRRKAQARARAAADGADGPAQGQTDE